MRVDVIGELANRICLAAVGDVDDLAPVDVDEQRDVVVPAFGGCLIDADAPQVREIEASQSCFDVVNYDAPERPCRAWLRHDVSCSPMRRAAAATGMWVTRVMASASNSSVKPEPGRAVHAKHGSAMTAH